MAIVFDFNSEFLVFKEFNSFQEKQAFQSIKELDYLSYYSDFKLILCSKCRCAIKKNNIKGHLNKHLNDIKNPKERKIVFSNCFSILNNLNVFSLSKSLELIFLFNNHFDLFAFSELNIKTFAGCLICKTVLSNEYAIKRHLKEVHFIDKKQENFQLLKGQSLEQNKYYFPIKSSDINLNSNNNNENDNNSLLDNSLNNLDLIINNAKEQFLKDFNNKKEKFSQELNNFELNSNDKLTPFQIKTRYSEYINRFNIQDLVDLLSPLKEEERFIEILIINLKEIFYLSLEKSIFLNKLHLMILNSFEDQKIRNKPFKPLLNNNTRVKYFNFFAQFIIYFFRAQININLNNINYFKINNITVDIINNLTDLIKEHLELIENEDYFKEVNKSLKDKRSKFNSKLNKIKINSIIQSEELSDNSSDSDNNSNFSSNFSSSSLNNSFNSDSDNNSLNNINLDSSNTDIIKEVEKINKSKDSLSKKIKSSLLNLLITLFKQKVDLNIFDSPINSFFAVISIRPINFSFKDSLQLSQDYSKFIYCTQLLIIEFIFSQVFKNNKLELNNLFKEFQFNYFTNSSGTALTEILLNRAYCFKINKEISTSNFVSISNTLKETVSYNKVTISVDNLKALFKEIITQAYNILIKELLLDINKSKYKDITLEEFSKFEDKSFNTPFKCFRDLHPASDINNNFIKDELFINQDLFKDFFQVSKSSDLINLRLKRVKSYLSSVELFKKRCLLLIYLTTGLPLRGTEVLTLRYLNSFKDLRELFLDSSNNLFILNISFHKSQGSSDKKAINIRYLCESVSNLFLLFIVLVDPFVEFLLITLEKIEKLNKNKSLLPYFFYHNNRLFSSINISQELRSLSNLVIGQKFGIQVYRQIIITIIKEFMQENINSETLLFEEDNNNNLSKLIAGQMNHSLQMEDMNYKRQVISFKNINSNLQFKYLQLCLRYFDFFDLSKIKLNINSFQNQLKVKNDLNNEKNLNLNNSLVIKYDKNNKKHRRQVSSISSINNPVIKKIKTIDLLNLSSLSISNSSILLNSMLQEFLQNNNASFKSLEQELLIKSILIKVPYILGILPTNTGKSLSYLLTSSLNISKVTIIIIPLLGLKYDILRRANEFNIPCSIYEDNFEFKNLTLISIESIKSSDFIFSVEQLINNNKLDRIIFDECHLLITSKSYRSIMFQVKNILKFNIQIIFLTGTLPYIFEQELIKMLFINEITIIRANCFKFNISYRIKNYISFKEEERIQEINNYIINFQSNEFLTKNDKVIIFCPSKNDVDLISNILNCSKYYSDLNQEDKQFNLNGFLNNSSDYFKILCSTNGLEEGFDYSFVRLVIYKDIIYSFIGFLQGSSRSGRDDQLSTSVFFIDKKKEFSSINYNSSDILNQDKLLINNYINEQVCRCRIINLYLDNKYFDNCLNNHLCDLCFKRNQIHLNQVNRIKEVYKSSEELLIEYKNQVINLNNNCTFCFLLSPIELVNKDIHNSFNCLLFNYLKLIAKEVKVIIEDKIKLSNDSCCFKCLLPTIICKQLEVNNDCLNRQLLYQVFAIFWAKKLELNLIDKYQLDSQITLVQFIKVFTQKIFFKELNTECILIFKELVSD